MVNAHKLDIQHKNVYLTEYAVQHVKDHIQPQIERVHDTWRYCAGSTP